ncbi:DNA polymerase III subunit delta [Thalassotalea sp. ND16A]|uniref:DNA polymerase III subunit delta n=1 Tax=Thalassotalea sp. ND16A TaxID=1535422 RepID=UPI00051A7892|nr:DNA polymerase III subunit delta [Thalassotalea sp. ND16A]KGJ97184.1 DNA-directed DNA polymerase [Thalassotalea sp. ND16A]
MRIYHSQLQNQLTKPLLNVWLVFGDEPWQKNDALDNIKLCARNQGFDELIRFSSDDKFDWNQVYNEYQSLSLFSARRIIEIDLVNNKLDDSGVKTLLDIGELISQQNDNDVLLILHGPKLDANASKKKWFKALDKIGCFIPLYELEGKGLTIWLNQQCQQLNLKMDSQAQMMLSDFFIGNTPALQQELQKLALLFKQNFIRSEDLEQLLIKQSKFTPFQLIDGLLAGNLSQCMNMLTQMKHEGVAAGQLVWILHKEIVQLEMMLNRMAKGEERQALFKELRIWDKKKPLYNHALTHITVTNIKQAKKRLAKTDLISKSSSDFDEYILLADVCLSLYHGDVTKRLSLEYEYS